MNGPVGDSKSIEIEMIGGDQAICYKGKSCYVTVTNPLKEDMTNLQISIDGKGITRTSTWKVSGCTIKPDGKVKIGPLSFTPIRRGDCAIYFDVDSDQVEDLKQVVTLS